MITKRQKFSLIYFLSNSLFLASGYSLIFKTSGKDAWISMIIGVIFGVFIISLFNILGFNKTKNYILNSKIHLIKKLTLSAMLIFIFFIDILIVRIFTTSFLLTKTPGIVITLPFTLLVYLNAKKGLNTISKIAEILMPISIGITIFASIAVLKDASITEFLPIYTTTKLKIFIAGLYYAIFTTIPQLSLFDVKIKLKDNIKSYLTSTLINILIGVLIISVLGPYLIKIFRFPEYMVLKQLKIFNFIEKVENLIGLIWFFDLFISSSICLYDINKITNSKYINIPLIIIILLTIEFITKHYEYAMFIYKNLPILLGITGIIFFITICNIKIKKSS